MEMILCSSKAGTEHKLIFAVLPACCLVISGVNSAPSVELCACKNCCVCSFKITRCVDFMAEWDCCETAFPFV